MRTVSFVRVRACLTLVAVASWLAALAGRQLGDGRSVNSAATSVAAELSAVSLCSFVGGLVWGRVRRAARQDAYRRRAAAQPACNTGTAGVVAWQAIAATGAVGCAAVVVHGDRGSSELRSVYSAAGRSGRRGHVIGSTTRFEIGSVTKIFTGLILADMAVRGEVDLDAPLGGLLGVPAANVLTFRSLATHTSGLPRRITVPPLIPLLTTHPNAYRGIDLDRITAALARRPPPVAGTFRYSNVGYQLLAAALAAAARTTWPDLIQRRICEPLGLTATGMSPDDSTAHGHDQVGFPFPYSDYRLLPGAIGLLSTTADLDRFIRAQLDPGSTPLGPAIRLSRIVQTPAGSSPPAGLGWRLRISGDATLAWHRGLTRSFSALLAVIDAAEARRGVAILTNSPYTQGLQAAGFRALFVISPSPGGQT